MKIIDSAVRLRSDAGKPDIAAWLRQMEKWGIARAVVAPGDEFVAVYNEEGNRWIEEYTRQYPERIAGLAVANPWYGKKAVKLLEKAFESGGMCGLYVNPARQGFHLTEHVIDPLIEVCVRMNKPVYSHTGTPICAMAFQLAELARRFPDTRFVMGHCAWTDFWYDVIPAAEQAENIIIDVSCTIRSTVRALIDRLGAHRVVFGSGYPKSLPENELEKIRDLNLPDDVFARLMHDNAIQLWGMDK